SGIAWAAGSNEIVNWNVAGTNNAPVSCANVDILLSTDGGQTYPITLASNVPNDGSHTISVPNNPTTTARIMVVCSDNIFFDISNNDFEIEFTGPDFSVSATPNSGSACQPDTEDYNVMVTGFGGFTENVNLSVTGVPVGASANFSVNPIVGGAGNSVLTVTSTGVAPGTYTLSIQAMASIGTKTINVEFIVLPGAPSMVTLSSPSDGSTNVQQSILLSWGVSADALGYDVEIATDASFTNIVNTQTNISNTSTTASGLATSTTYYWRVRAVNPCGMSAWSTVWSFTTQSVAPCTQYRNTPLAIFNPVPSACFNNCTAPTTNTQVNPNRAYVFYNMMGGEEYTFEFCNGYNPATWEAVITVAQYNTSGGAPVPNSEIATTGGCSITFTVPTSGDYILIISDANDCGGTASNADNGNPTFSCTGLTSCCGAIFTDPLGAAQEYQNDLNLTYTLCPDLPGQMIEVTFSQFSIEQYRNGTDCWDYLTVYDGNSTAAPQIGGEYCDRTGSPGTVTSTSADGCLTFQFESDGSVTQDGWVADVECIGGPVSISPKVYLQGPWVGSSMNNNLGSSNMIPTTSPYSDGKTATTSVLANMIDWVYVEIRDPATGMNVLEGQSALLRPDGTVVDVDGASPLIISQNAGNYHVVIRHRNHLSIMTGTAVLLN
ncbi:MAG: CUB domain-containing protein, partial [Bacteroidota bacterium]